MSAFRGIALAAAVLTLLLVMYSRTSPPIVTDSDIAVTEIYTDLAADGELRLGPYSRFGWHHPGPLYFYLQAPLYVAAGRRAASLFAGATALNIAALCLLVWIVAREDRGFLAPLTASACLFVAWRAPRLLASPWTAHVPLIPSVTLVALCAALAAGRVSLLPVAIFVGSVVVQTHLGFAPPVVAMLLGAIAIAVYSARAARGFLIRQAWQASAVLLIVWMLPVTEALSPGGGNVGKLWRFFVTGETARAGHSLTEAIAAASYGLTAVFRSDLTLPWGGHFSPKLTAAGVALAVAQVVCLILIGARAIRDGRRFEGYFAFASLVAMIVITWTLTRVADDILDHEVFWLSLLGAVNCATVASAVISHLGRTAPALQAPFPRNASTVAVLLIAIAMGAYSLRDFTAFERRRTDRVTIVRMYAAIRRYMSEERLRKPLILIEPRRWSQAAGVLLRLRQDRSAPAVSDEWIPMFTPSFRRRGGEEATIAIGGAAFRAHEDGQADGTLLFESSGLYVYGSRAGSPQAR